MISTFSFKRLGMILRWNLSNNMHKSLQIMCFLAIALAVVYNQITISTKIPDDIDIDSTMRLHLLSLRALVFVTPFVFCGAATRICNDIRSKAQRTTHLMLPGTSAEKFVARLLIATLGVIPLLMGALCIADVIQYLLSYIFQSDFHESLIWQTMRLYMLPHSPGHWSDLLTIHSDIQYNLVIYSLILWMHSVCLLCGTIFRKQSGALAILIVILFLGFSVQTDINYSQRIAEIIIAVFTLLSVVNYVLSYIVFKRIQIASNKYLNINIPFCRL